MTGHFLTLGGTSVDDDHTLKSKITTGAGELTDGQLILKGEFTHEAMFSNPNLSPCIGIELARIGARYLSYQGSILMRHDNL